MLLLRASNSPKNGNLILMIELDNGISEVILNGNETIYDGKGNRHIDPSSGRGQAYQRKKYGLTVES